MPPRPFCCLLDGVLTSFLRKVGISEIDAIVNFKLAPLASRRDIAMLGVIHRAVLGEGPPQLREFFKPDRRDLRRCARHFRHDHQLAIVFGGRPLGMIKRSVLGLCHAYNLLPANIVQCHTVKAFQGALQHLLCEQAVAGRPQWQALFSPRWPVQQHPLLHMV